MLKYFLILLLVPFLSVNSSAHMEVVAYFDIHHVEGETFISAKVDKQNLTNALKEEGDCSLNTMMKICGDKYIQNNFRISVDGALKTMTLVDFRIEKDQVVFEYRIKQSLSEAYKIQIDCTYMQKYNGHSITRTSVDLLDQQKTYDFTSYLNSVSIFYVKNDQ